ncbi:MAG: cell wall hydrolase [Sphingomonas adhaesiva]|uniref:cell wall hydrolase n=1 Tax=Sphingomonas adhaesiva TaxID=28212 RepID=UPI002FF7D304
MRASSASITTPASVTSRCRISCRRVDLSDLSWRLRAILGGIAAAAIAVPAAVVTHPPAIPAALPPALVAKVKRPQRVVAATEVPEVEPVEFQSLDPADARAWNASIPFVRGPKPAARPFRFAGDEQQRARATDCLAAAAYYEAGDDPVGQKAVVQVVLNRLRHPAFPKTVCEVVFQGSERSTGCQFTFTCDGALARIPSPPAWDRARRLASKALNGAVDRTVGYATHYHTDWVVPYWSASLDKIAEVHTHLFFRWTGWWGTPAAFRRSVSAQEPVVAKLAAVSPVHRLGSALDEAALAVAAAAPLADGLIAPAPATIAAASLAGTPRALPDDPDTFLVVLDPRTPEAFPALALKACGERARCKLMGWIDARLLPNSLTMSPAQYQGMGFSYLRDRAGKLERTLWNCQQFPREAATQCMRGRATLTATPAPAPTARGPEGLTGVRRAPAPVAGPTIAVPEM